MPPLVLVLLHLTLNVHLRLCSAQQTGCDLGYINIQMMAIIQPACCNDGGTCSSGVPETCSAGCAAAFLPFTARCGTTISAITLIHDSDDQLADLARRCQQQAGAGSSNTYAHEPPPPAGLALAPLGSTPAAVATGPCASDLSYINIQMMAVVQPACCDDGCASGLPTTCSAK